MVKPQDDPGILLSPGLSRPILGMLENSGTISPISWTPKTLEKNRGLSDDERDKDP
jgi:hypothetical protein